jgi:hypothetical protein
VGGFLAAALAVVWTRLTVPPTPDVAWLLYAAGVLRDGGTLGVDVVENSPPIIFWLKIPVLAFGDLLGLPAWPSWIGALLVLTFASALLVGRLSKNLACGAHLGLLAGAVLVLLPGREFGQREHAALILTAPWLIVIARRLEGRPAQGAGLWLTIALAAAGLGIKPHFGLVWLAVACLLAARARSFGALLRPEVTGVAVLGLLQVVAVAVFHPSYFEHLRLYGRAYVGFLAIPIWQALFVGAGPAAVLFALLARIALRGTREQSAEGSTALLVGAIGFWLAAGLQQKGWPYHYLPAQGIGLLAIGALLVETPATGMRLAARIYRGVGLAVLAMALLTPAVHAVLQAARLEPPDRGGLDRNLELLLPMVRAAGEVGPVFVFSTNIGSSFPLVSEAGARWAFRHPSLLMLGAAYSRATRRRRDGAAEAAGERTAAERRLAGELAADLQDHRPAAILVVRPDVGNPGWGGAKRFDYLGYFQAEPQFTRILADYKDAGVFGDYSLLLRGGVTVPVEPGHPSTASGHRFAIGFGGGRVRWTVDPLGLVLFGLGFGAAYGVGGRGREVG